MTELSPIDNLAALGELAAAMNHEHGNLLAALKAWIDAPSLGIPAAEAMEHAAKIVDKMIGIQRAEQLCVVGLKREESVHIALDELLSHALTLATPRLRAKGVGIAVDQPEQATLLICNPGRAIADIFFLLLRVAGEPKEDRRRLILTADLVGNDVQVTAFLDSTPKVREFLRISASVGI